MFAFSLGHRPSGSEKAAVLNYEVLIGASSLSDSFSLGLKPKIIDSLRSWVFGRVGKMRCLTLSPMVLSRVLPGIKVVCKSLQIKLYLLWCTGLDQSRASKTGLNLRFCIDSDSLPVPDPSWLSSGPPAIELRDHATGTIPIASFQPPAYCASHPSPQTSLTYLARGSERLSRMENEF
jgi:hypothetical protein